MADEIARTSREKDLQQQGFDDIHVKLNSVFENVELLKKGHRLMVSLPGSPKPAVDRVVRTIRSEGGTPILGSETIEPSV